VHDRLMELGARLTLKTVDAIIDGTVKPIPQSALSIDKPTPAPKIFKDTCHIDWNKPAQAVHNLVRGLSPYPAAWTDMGNNESLKIFATRITGQKAEAPGTVHADGSTLTVDCSDYRIEILSLQPQGKKRMDAASWLRGVRGLPEKFS
ncbi:MAG: methionyl-tRNA formyltransferase, partial [Paramuribaculum sp.]|nr:methionyl-tRNA formyltransferase [Paramuribaculum sp.]